MKKTIAIILVAVSALSALGQETYTTREVIQIQKEQTFYLTAMDSRASFPVSIPENTVQWFIAFTSNVDGESSSPLNLFGKIASSFDPTGISGIAVDALTAPKGNAQCYVMLSDLDNRNIFIDGNDGYEYFINPSRQNITEGVIIVDGSDFYGNFYILVFNPSYTSAIDITIEVTAIVEYEETDMSVWSKETRDQFYQALLSDLIDSEYEDGVAKELANCLVKKITNEHSPEEVTQMSEFELNQMQETFTNKCIEDMSGGAKTEAQEKASNYGSLGWKSYENGDIDKCIEYSKKALTLDNTLGWVKANLGLSYLVKGDEMTATDYYLDAISALKKDKLNGKDYFEEIIQDIDNALKKYPELKGYKEIKSLLQGELDKY